MNRMEEGFALLVSIAVPQAAGFIGSVFTRAGLHPWYASLDKPAFTPPSWVFAPAWITLYLLMGVSAFLVWRRGWNTAGVRSALAIFGIQLAVNAFWSYAFFGLHSPSAGLAVIIVLWALILLTTIRFAGISRTAAALLIPYLLWVSFAAVLNGSISAMN